MQKEVVFSECLTYRYMVKRTWDAQLPTAMFIGLNPSETDGTDDNPTITRCLNFARHWGYGSVYLANLFAYRATQPQDMKTAQHPVGADNNAWLRQLATESAIIIAAWGNDGTHLQRSAEVRQLLPTLHCLKINQSGEPAHPLYQKATATPIPYPAPAP